VYSDLVLIDFVGLSTQGAFTDVNQEFGEQGRSSEARTRRNPLRQLPARIICQIEAFPLRLRLWL
jgi:hypothetical protein